MSKIANLTCQLVDLVPATVRTDASQSFVKQETVLVTIETADGLAGNGYSYTIGTGGSAVLAMLRDHLAGELLGEDARNVERLWQRMLSVTRATTVGAITSLAMAAVDELGFTGLAKLRDVWQKRDIGSIRDEFTAALPAHGSRLLKVTPKSPALAAPARVHGTGSTASSVSLAWDPTAGSGAQYAVSANGREVARTGANQLTVSGLTAATGYTFTVRTVSGGRTSGPSAAVDVTTPAAAGPTTYEAEGPQNTLAGSASIYGCDNCSGDGKVGYLGGNGTLSMPVTVPVAGTYLMKVAYIDGDSSRQGVISVNGADQWINMHGSGDNDWGTPQDQVVPVTLKAGANTVAFSNPSWFLGDVDAITV